MKVGVEYDYDIRTRKEVLTGNGYAHVYDFLSAAKSHLINRWKMTLEEAQATLDGATTKENVFGAEFYLELPE